MVKLIAAISVSPYHISLLSCPRVNLLTVLAPGVYPSSLFTGEGISSDSQDLANRRCTPCMEPFGFHVIGDVKGSTLLDDIERGAVALQLTLTSTDCLDLFAVLVVDVIPVFRCFNRGNTLATDTHDREQQDEYGEYNLHFGSSKIMVSNYNQGVSSILLLFFNNPVRIRIL